MKDLAEKRARVTRGKSRGKQAASSGSSNVRSSSLNNGQASRGRSKPRSSSLGNEKAKSGQKRKAPKDKSPAKKIRRVQEPVSKIVRRMVNGKMGDVYCWVCHKPASDYNCPDCERVYHNDCRKKTKRRDEPPCECKWTGIDSFEGREFIPSDLERLLTPAVEHALKVKKNRKFTSNDIYFLLNEWPDSKENSLLCQIISLHFITDRISSQYYTSTGEVFQDIKWLYHNSYIAYGPEHKVTVAALQFEKIMKQHLSDIEGCSECFFEKISLSEEFFTLICSNPHPIIWAKLKGFPFWPAKCLRIVNGLADVRFFGTHDKSLVPLSQIYRLSMANPGGPPKKSKSAARRNSYEEAMSELENYIQNYENEVGSFQYYKEKTPLELNKTSERRSRQSRYVIQNQLEDPVSADINENNEESSPTFLVENNEESSPSFLENNMESSQSILDYSGSSDQNVQPLLNVSLLHDDTVVETKKNIVRPTTVVENSNNDLPQDTMESNVLCHMTFHEECPSELNTTYETIEESSDPQLLISNPVSVASLSEVHTDVTTLQVHENNNESSEDYIDNLPSTSAQAPCLITSTRSLQNTVANTVNEITKITDAVESSKGNLKKVVENLLSEQGLPGLFLEGDDDEIQVVQENQRKSLVDGVFKNQPMLKTFCELLLGNKPSVRNYVASFQNMALHFYLAMWLEANTGKVDADDCKVFHTFCEKLCKTLELYRAENMKLKKEREEIQNELESLKPRLLGKTTIREQIIKQQAAYNHAKANIFKNEINRARAECAEARRMERSYKDRAIKFEKAFNLCQTEAAHLKKDNEIYKQNVQDLTDENRRLIEDCESTVKEILADNEKKSEDVIKQMLDLVIEQAKKKEDLQNKYAEQIKNEDNYKKMAQETIDYMQKGIEEGKELLKNEEKKKDQAEARVKELEKAITEKDQDIIDFKKQIFNLNGRNPFFDIDNNDNSKEGAENEFASSCNQTLTRQVENKNCTEVISADFSLSLYPPAVSFPQLMQPAIFQPQQFPQPFSQQFPAHFLDGQAMASIDSHVSESTFVQESSSSIEEHVSEQTSVISSSKSSVAATKTVTKEMKKSVSKSSTRKRK